MFWVVQSNLHREDGHARLISALERAGSRFVEVQILPFIDKIVPADVDIAGQDAEALPDLKLPASTTSHEATFGIGSYKLARLMRARHVLGAYIEGLKYTEWSAGWGHENLLNPHAWVGPLRDANPSRPSFVRPVADSKEFAGRAFDPAAFRLWRAGIAQEGNLHVPQDTEILVVPMRRDIHTETRVWVVDGRVVTFSSYKRGGVPNTMHSVDKEVTRFAQRMADRWCPNPAFVIDIAQTSEGPKVVEANCLSAAGFYNGDMQKIVFALEDYFAGWKP